MKASRYLLALACAAGVQTLQANPEVPQAVARHFGSSVAESILLLKGTASTAEPVEWTVYSRDAFRPSDTVRISVKRDGAQWQASATGSGSRVLDRVPPRTIDFRRLRYRSADARVVAAKAAALAQATFATIDYQLAAHADTGAPEWGLALRDDTGYEVGFVVVSGETGAISFQDWTPRVSATTPDSEGERAAKAVKRTARKAWNWTDNARKETRNFFRELFR